MNKEERQAIDILQNCIADYVIGDYCVDNCEIEECKNKDCIFITAIDKVVNLIDKQQKELDNAMLKIKQILKLKENVEITKGLEMIQELLEEK